MRALTLLLLSTFMASSAYAQVQKSPKASVSCSVDADISCAAHELTPSHGTDLAAFLFAAHEAGGLDLERLLMVPMSQLNETSPPLILRGALTAIKEVAPEVVAQHRADLAAPSTADDHAVYVHALLVAFIEADVDLSDRPVAEKPTDPIQVEVVEISGSDGSP
ncbi:MAG: hypothetical protein AAFX41_02915 [Bacteroidota bacterium]